MENEMVKGPARRRVLFLCIGNSCRSQLAEAMARHWAADVIDPASAGLRPLGRISEATRTVGEELGLSFDGQSSKGFSAADIEQADLIVNMSGIPADLALGTAKAVVNWEVADPYGEDLALQRRIAAEIEARVICLAAELRAAGNRSSAG